MMSDWRYTKPPPTKWKKFKDAVATIATFIFFITVLVTILGVTFFADWDEEPTTTTAFTTTTLGTTTTVDPALDSAYCEGWYTGQVTVLISAGIPEADAVTAVGSGATHPCDATNRYGDTYETAWCEGMVEGYTDVAMPYAGPPPHGWAEDAIATCLSEELYNKGQLTGGGGPAPLEN